MAGAEGPLWLLQGHQRQGRRPRGRVCEAGDAGGLRRAGACGAAEQGGAKYPKNDGILAAKGVDWKHAESRLVQGLASLNSARNKPPPCFGRIRKTGNLHACRERNSTLYRTGGPRRPFAEEEKLIARAKAEGFFGTRHRLIKSNLGWAILVEEPSMTFGLSMSKRRTNCHPQHHLGQLWFSRPLPCSIPEALEDYNQAFPALQTRLIGVSRNARGNGSSGRRSRSWKRWNSRMTNAFKACWRKRL